MEKYFKNVEFPKIDEDAFNQFIHLGVASFLETLLMPYLGQKTTMGCLTFSLSQTTGIG